MTSLAVWSIAGNPSIIGLKCSRGERCIDSTTGTMYIKQGPSDTDWMACGECMWPVGAVFLSVVATNPRLLLGFGTWVAFGAGRMLVGIDSGDAAFDTAEETGGEKSVTLTEAQIPSHSHVTRIRAAGLIGSVGVSGALAASTADASDGATASTGGGQSHNNLPPYIVVYMFKRSA